ncbi:Ubiquitin carboxyl-terminal hydrolase [Entamoeba marina]
MGITNVNVDWVYALEKDCFPPNIIGFIFCLPYSICKTTLLSSSVSSNVKPLHIQQCIGNVCGATALLHCLINSPKVQYDNNSLYSTLKLTMENAKTDLERGKAMGLLKEVHSSIAELSKDIVAETSVDGEEVFHFEAFMELDNKIWVVDGRKNDSIAIQETTDYLSDVAKVLQERIQLSKFSSILVVTQN